MNPSQARDVALRRRDPESRPYRLSYTRNAEEALVATVSDVQWPSMPFSDRGNHLGSEFSPWVTRGSGLAVGAGLAIGLMALAVAASGVLVLLFIAIVLASAIEPIIGSVRGRLPVGRGTSILLVYLSFFISVVGLALVVVPIAISQGEQVAAGLPRFFDSANAWASTLRPEILSTSVSAVTASAAKVVGASPPPGTEEVTKVGTFAAEAAITFTTLLTIVFFWLVEHARLQRYLLAYVAPERRAGIRDAWNDIESRLGMWARGQLLLMAAMGLATGLAYTFLGLPVALLLALVAALAEAIPIVGPLLGAIPAVLVAATVSPQLAIEVALVYVVLQLVEGSVLVPMIMRNAVGISPLFVLLSLLVGGAVAGILGALLAVPIAASVEIILTRFQAREIPVAEDVAAIKSSEPAPEDGRPAKQDAAEAVAAP